MSVVSSVSSFVEFPKLARLSRDCVISEKIDGTNTQVLIWREGHLVPLIGDTMVPAGPPPGDVPWIWCDNDAGLHLAVGSRTKWITPTDDNHGFARWALEHAADIVQMGHGRHFGEWWGSGIQRGYGLPKGEKRLSLFNVSRWCLHGGKPQRISAPDAKTKKWQDVLPWCVGLVPVLYSGLFTTEACSTTLERLRTLGSVAAPGFMKAEGIVCWHTAANMGFKKTLVKDEVPKSLA